MASHHYRRDGNVFRIHGRTDVTPWTDPNSYQPEKLDAVELLRKEANRRRSVLERCCDCLADFVADCMEKPGTALVLLSLGQMSVIIPALLWAVLS